MKKSVGEIINFTCHSVPSEQRHQIEYLGFKAYELISYTKTIHVH